MIAAVTAVCTPKYELVVTSWLLAAWAVLTGLTNLPIVGATKPGQPPAQPGQGSVASRAVNQPLGFTLTIKNL